MINHNLYYVQDNRLSGAVLNRNSTELKKETKWVKNMNEDGETTDYKDITESQQETWSAGDFNQIARLNVGMAEELVRDTDPHAGERVLDVACGSGTAALVAARRYCETTGIDYVPELVERAEMRATAEGLEADFHVGDVQDMPYPDDSFDVVLSVYGVQFAADQERAASEMLRVCRPGGKIGLAGPVPEGWSGDWFAAHAKYSPPPPGAQSPLRWGTEEGLEELLGRGVRAIENERRTAHQYYRSVDHSVEVFSTYFGPTVQALDELDTEDREELMEELHGVMSQYNSATDGTAVVENQYLQTTAIKE